MTNPLYRGYSSVASGIDTAIFDIELVKRDILNHFNTRMGERVGRPTFGSIIWDLLFNLSDYRTEALVIRDAERILGSDPRVKVLNIKPLISLETHVIMLDITVRYVEIDMVDNFTVTFRS